MTGSLAQRLTLWITVVLAAGIAYGTLTPVAEMPESPSGVDKLYHFVSFAALVLPAIAAQPRNALWLAPLAVAYGGLIELIQPQVGRSAELGDFVANSLGVAFGVLVGVAAHRMIWPLLTRRARG